MSKVIDLNKYRKEQESTLSAYDKMIISMIAKKAVERYGEKKDAMEDTTS